MDRFKINIALHKVRGLHACLTFTPYDDGFWKCSECVESGKEGVSKLPNYCSDLNIMAEVESEFDAQQKREYVVNLQTVYFDYLIEMFEWKYITAPAHIRAEAALEVLTRGK